MIELNDYFIHNGVDRREQYLCDASIELNVVTLLTRVNALIEAYQAATGNTFNGRINSGWRPPEINACTPNAAAKSKHMTGQAIDLNDDDGDIDEWLMTEQGQKIMADVHLWHEHPSATKGWAHLQSVAPNSGRRTFYP